MAIFQNLPEYGCYFPLSETDLKASKKSVATNRKRTKPVTSKKTSLKWDGSLQNRKSQLFTLLEKTLLLQKSDKTYNRHYIEHRCSLTGVNSSSQIPIKSGHMNIEIEKHPTDEQHNSTSKLIS